MKLICRSGDLTKHICSDCRLPIYGDYAVDLSGNVVRYFHIYRCSRAEYVPEIGGVTCETKSSGSGLSLSSRSCLSRITCAINKWMFRAVLWLATLVMQMMFTAWKPDWPVKKGGK